MKLNLNSFLPENTMLQWDLMDLVSVDGIQLRGFNKETGEVYRTFFASLYFFKCPEKTKQEINNQIFFFEVIQNSPLHKALSEP